MNHFPLIGGITKTSILFIVYYKTQPLQGSNKKQQKTKRMKRKKQNCPHLQIAGLFLYIIHRSFKNTARTNKFSTLKIQSQLIRINCISIFQNQMIEFLKKFYSVYYLGWRTKTRNT